MKTIIRDEPPSFNHPAESPGLKDLREKCRVRSLALAEEALSTVVSAVQAYEKGEIPLRARGYDDSMPASLDSIPWDIELASDWRRIGRPPQAYFFRILITDKTIYEAKVYVQGEMTANGEVTSAKFVAYSWPNGRTELVLDTRQTAAVETFARLIMATLQ